MALIEDDPFFWPDIKHSEALFIHKLAVTNTARKTGVSVALLNYAKEQGRKLGVETIRLDTDASRPKTRKFYENNGFEMVEIKKMGPYSVAFYVFYLNR